MSCFFAYLARQELARSGLFAATDQRIPRLTIVFLRNERHVFVLRKGALKKRKHEQAQAVSCFQYLARLKELESLTFFRRPTRSIQLS